MPAIMLMIFEDDAVSSNTAPEITILGNSTEFVTQNTVYLDAGATASDAEDGDITNSIQPTSTVNTSIVGSYTVTYDVTDSGGLTDQATRTVVTGAGLETMGM